MAGIVCCSGCGNTAIVVMTAGEYEQRFGALPPHIFTALAAQPVATNGQQPAAAPAPPAGQQPRQRQEDPDAPICGRCNVNRVGKRRNGSWFPTCYNCG